MSLCRDDVPVAPVAPAARAAPRHPGCLLSCCHQRMGMDPVRAPVAEGEVQRPNRWYGSEGGRDVG
eukprot:8403007-Pyramimonas_sp.AAC.2